MAHHVLVTGAAGTIGRIACRFLTAAGHRVRGFDRIPCTDGAEDHVLGSILDGWRLHEAAKGCDTLVHLAATPDDADFVSDLAPNNIGGTWNALEAARQAGMRRVVLASTLRVIGGLTSPGRGVITAAEGTRPGDAYSFSKVAVEEMGRFFHQRHALSVICARFGWVIRNRRESLRYRPDPNKKSTGRSWYLSHDDCGRFLVAAVAAAEVTLANLFVLSDNDGQRWVDLDAAAAAIGWSPKDTWPQGTPPEVIGE